MKHINFIVPTFKELDSIKSLVNSFSNIKSSLIKIIIVNGNPYDVTSDYLMKCMDKRILELHGDPSLFWSGLVNIGINYSLNQDRKPNFVFIMNADITFSKDILSDFLEVADNKPNCLIAATTISKGQVVSSGVKVRSWTLTINRHPLAGLQESCLNPDELICVDYLPTRCVMIPFSGLQKAGLTLEERLPHYGADYEYTSRLKKLGYMPFITTRIKIYLNAQNTGMNVFSKPLNFKERFKSIFSIKSPSNPLTRIRFILIVYPWFSIPTAVMLYLLRTVLEILFGGGVLKRVLSRKELGFSGH